MGGVCVDACNPAGCPSVDELVASGADGVRLVAFDDERFFAYCADLHLWSHLSVAVVLARESFGDDDFGGWASYYAERCQPHFWIPGNEPDAYLLAAPSPSSWKMRPEEYAAFWHATAVPLLARQPTARLLVAGLVSGQPGWAHGVKPLLTPPPYGWDIHPYGKDAAGAAALLTAYQEALG